MHESPERSREWASERGWFRGDYGLPETMTDETELDAHNFETNKLLAALPRCNWFLLLVDETGVYNSPGAACDIQNPARQPTIDCAGLLVMWEAAIAVGGLIIFVGVLWLRPWYDDHSHPYD